MFGRVCSQMYVRCMQSELVFQLWDVPFENHELYANDIICNAG